MALALASWFRDLRVRTTFIVVGRFGGRAGVRIEAEGVAAFHYVLRGECVVAPDGEPVLRLDEGDFLFMRRGLGREVWSGGVRGAGPTPIRGLVQARAGGAAMAFSIGGGASEHVIVGGGLCLENPESQPFVSALPPVVVARSGAPRMKGLRAIVEELVGEASSPGAGTGPVIARLAEVAALLGLRAFASTPDHGVALLGAARDPQLGRALAAMHDQPARPWTVASLGRIARMSRSGFAAKFVGAVGETPAAYLLRVRVARAERLFAEHDWPMARVAEAVGYDSAAAFSVAFKRVRGIAPGEARRLARAPPQPQ